MLISACLLNDLHLSFLLQQFDIGNQWFELASTITPVSQANRLTKCANYAKTQVG